MKRRIIEFLKATSVKGVPRTFRTNSPLLRTLWIVSVVSFLITASYLTHLLTNDYLGYASVISLREYNIDLTGTTLDTVRFPDITFCNLNPFAVSTHNLTNIPSLEAYHKRALDMTSCEDCSLEQQRALKELRVELLTTSGYYIHIGASKAKSISHSQDRFIVSCMIRLLSGMHPRKVPCEGVATIAPYYDYMFYNCYTVKLPPGTPENMYEGIFVVLQLGNHVDIIEQQKYLTPHYIPGQMSGAMMIFHQQNHLPSVLRDAINLPSGNFMTAKLRFNHRKRLPYPYGTCQHKDGLKSRYQQIICYSTCIQTLVLKSCACVDYTSYNDFFDLLAQVGIPPCLSLKVGKQRLHDNWECAKQIRLNSTSHCLSSCPIPCEDLTYSYDVSSMYFDYMFTVISLQRWFWRLLENWYLVSIMLLDGVVICCCETALCHCYIHLSRSYHAKFIRANHVLCFL